jgi:hypothetical protein
MPQFSALFEAPNIFAGKPVLQDEDGRNARVAPFTLTPHWLSTTAQQVKQLLLACARCGEIHEFPETACGFFNGGVDRRTACGRWRRIRARDRAL